MKYAVIILLILMNVHTKGQSIDVKEGNEKVGGAFRNVLTVVIYESDGPSILRSWKKRMRDANAKVKNSGDEVFADNAMLSDLSNNAIDVYASIQKENEGVRFSVAFDLGGTYLSESQNSGGFRAAKKMIYTYALEVTKEAIDLQIKNAEAEAKKLEWKQTDLERDNEHLHRDIDSYKEKISKAEKGIEENLKSQEENKKKIAEKNKALEEIKAKALKVK
jgi:flagellar motility protein MotE (MotC chaperone)